MRMLNRKIEDYYRYAERLEIPRGNYIYDSDDDFKRQHACLLDSGICALTTLTREGENKIHLYFAPKRMVGFAQLGEERLSECMKQLTDQPISIIAKTDCVIYKMKGSVFHQLMKEDLAFCNLMYDILTENYLNIFQRYIQMEEASVPVRICTLLLDYCVLQDGEYMLPHFFTYTEIANYLSIHPVTVSRVMIALKERGCIIRHGQNVLVQDRALLGRVAHKDIILKY